MLKGYKTVLAALVVGLIPLLEMQEVIDLIPEDYKNYYMIGVAIVMVLLRVATTTPIFKNKEQ